MERQVSEQEESTRKKKTRPDKQAGGQTDVRTDRYRDIQINQTSRQTDMSMDIDAHVETNN